MTTSNQTDVYFITLHWWNMGRKTLDFKGDIREFLKQKNFKIKPITHPRIEDAKGYAFKFELSSREVLLKIYHKSFEEAAIEAIQIFLTLLGDRATIQAPNKFISINH